MPRRIRPIDRARRCTALVIVGALGLAVAFGTAAFAGDSGGRGVAPFAGFAPREAPAGWHRLELGGGAASLAYPPAFVPVASDPGSASAALGPGPAYRAYLNITPRQGGEAPQHFARFRVSHLREEGDRSVHNDGARSSLRFAGGTGAGVVDDYVTRVGGHHYDEFAVLVTGRRHSWVVVGSGLAAHEAEFQSSIERALESFRTS